MDWSEALNLYLRMYTLVMLTTYKVSRYMTTKATKIEFGSDVLILCLYSHFIVHCAVPAIANFRAIGKGEGGGGGGGGPRGSKNTFPSSMKNDFRSTCI